MIRTIPFLALFLTISSLLGGEKPSDLVVELPRPNSGTFSFKQTEGLKSEILSNEATPMLMSWENPFSGFSIHIHDDDSITIYGSSGLMRLAIEEKRKLTKQSVKDVKKMADSIPLYGNPAGILITSDAPLKQSKNIHKILAEIFVPSIQLFYTNCEQ